MNHVRIIETFHGKKTALEQMAERHWTESGLGNTPGPGMKCVNGVFFRRLPFRTEDDNGGD